MFEVNVSLTKSKARVLSNISADIAQVFFAASVGAAVLPLDSSKLFVVIFYLLLSVLFWYLSIIFAEKGKI